MFRFAHCGSVYAVGRFGMVLFTLWVVLAWFRLRCGSFWHGSVFAITAIIMCAHKTMT